MKQIVPLIMLFLLSSPLVRPAVGQRRGDPPYTEATFAFSCDPTKVVLHITQSSEDMYIRSMTLYGDGRVELQIKAGTHRIVAEHTRDLDHEEVQKILRGAVDHGLAEWDNARIHSLQLRQLDGRPYGAPTDGDGVTVLLALESYQRGAYSMRSLERTVTVRAPSYTARAFPDIPEFKGIENLLVLLHQQLTQAETEAKP